MVNMLRRLGREDSGQSLVEYTLVAAIVALIFNRELTDFGFHLDELAFLLRTASARIDMLW